MSQALTPECFDGLCSLCDSDSCGCVCHVRFEDDEELEPYNDSDGEPDYTLDDPDEFEESLELAMRWPRP